jgi:hypothetical protein
LGCSFSRPSTRLAQDVNGLCLRKAAGGLKLLGIQAIKRDQMHARHMDLSVLGWCAHIEELDAGVGLKDGLEFSWLDGCHRVMKFYLYIAIHRLKQFVFYN